MKLLQRLFLPLAAFPFLPAALPATPLVNSPEVPAARPQPAGSHKAATPAGILVAQSYMRPPSEIGESGDSSHPEGQQPGPPEDSAGLLVRLGRLENQ
ncbi:MAG: hypothetical protein J2P49_09215, partial [Methylocapsa sp.]|nr:hypothetical protein [Methylocapsa sp.]